MRGLRRIGKIYALSAAGMLLALSLSTEAQAQQCTPDRVPLPVYEGCTPCEYAENVLVTVCDDSGCFPEFRFVSGVETICGDGFFTPLPSVLISVFTSEGFLPVTCHALFPLPQTGNQCVIVDRDPGPHPDPNQRYVFRYYWNKEKDHFHTLHFGEGRSFATYEGIGFSVFVNPVDTDMHPLYRCWWKKATNHLISRDARCEGLVFEGLYGYVSSIPRPGFVPLYRLYHSRLQDHLITVNIAEAIPGWTNEGIIGYVPQ